MIRDFLFPRQCLHCKEEISNRQNFFCLPCQELLEFVSDQSRCRSCFRPQLPCAHCLKHPTIWNRRAALFEEIGPAKSLQCALHEPGVLELLASMIVIQLEKLQWQLPNEIHCQPHTIFEKIERGEDSDPKLVKLLRKKLKPKKSKDPIILVVTTDGREVDEEKLLRKFPKELLRLDVATRHLHLTS